MVSLALWSCDPRHKGELYVQNDSEVELEFVISGMDTVPDTVRIAPGSKKRILEFGGLGAGQHVNCCPCELRDGELQPTDSAYTILPDVRDNDEWRLYNTNDNISDRDLIKCVLILTDSDMLYED